MLDATQWFALGISAPVALASVAVIGYLFGRTQRNQDEREDRRRRDRTDEVIRELESISANIRRTLARHHSNVQRFRERIADLGRIPANNGVNDAADEILEPAVSLSTDLARAYDEIRQQTRSLTQLKSARQGSNSEVPV